MFMCVQYGQATKYCSPTPNLSSVSGIARTGAALSHFAIVFGESAAWCPMSGDYYGKFFFPLFFGMMLANNIVNSTLSCQH